MIFVKLTVLGGGAMGRTGHALLGHSEEATGSVTSQRGMGEL